MSGIFEYKCSRCKFKLPEGRGHYLYVETDKGERVVCGHPAERRIVEEVLGERPSLEVVQERTGFNSDRVCLDCLHQFEADLGETGYSPYEEQLDKLKPRLKQEKDKRECPKCRSMNVKTALELVDETCPKCKEGVIEEVFTGEIS